MATTELIRYRLLSIVLLGVVTSALSLFALERALSTSMSVRRQKAHEIVAAEVDRLAATVPSAAALRAGSVTTYLGVRGGWVTRAADLPQAPGLPAAWLPALADALDRAGDAHGRVLVELDQSPNTVVIGAAPMRAGGFAWVTYQVVPLQALQTWRLITIALAIATALLVFTVVWATLLFRRSAAALNSTLTALGKDLTTPVPTPRVAELSGIADGIRAMSRELQVSREATERLARELSQKERLAALGRVAAGVAHEVRNPLASIKLRLDLTAAGELPEAARKAVTAASSEIARLDRLVSDLLLVAGKQLGPRRAVGLGALAQARVESLRPWAQARGVTVEVRGDIDADVDAESVARALDNLVRNAVEASPSGGSVEVRVAAAAAPGTTLVEVEDHGVGVETARTSELFEPFFTTKAEGTGLGLAISRAIARAHGGDVTYARAGDVTRFCLSLPRAREANVA
ncbi:MAG: Flagellar sensor histidine kinase FleS [Myxococcales bacterium]|nr:Flagellar sensor histidine kinase FleS [Myxococcales bacterium]